MQTLEIKTAVLAALLMFSAGQAWADPINIPQDNNGGWLGALALAAHRTDYSGTFVYQYDNHVEVSRIVHVFDSAGEHSRMERLDGPPHVIIRNNDEVWCYFGNRRVRVELRQGGREFPALLPQQLSLLGENYRIRQGETARVAGFPAHAILFQPRDALRYIHKMWAHDGSGLLLKAIVLDDRGSMVEQYMFTQLEINDKNPHSAQPGASLAPETSRDRKGMTSNTPPAPVPFDSTAQNVQIGRPDTAQPAGTEPVAVVSGWQAEVPPGFKKIAEVRRMLPGKREPVIQMAFSDGLAGISVFVEKAPQDDDNHEGLTSQGVIQAYSRMVDDRLVTVIGEVPPRTVMRIANSVRNAGGQHD